MDKDINNRGRILRSRISNDNSIDLYRILQKNKVKCDKLLQYTQSLFSSIDDDEIKALNGKEIPGILLKLVGIPEEIDDIILKFIWDEGLIEIEEGILQLTPCGRLFLMSDDISSSMDLIKYFWEKLDWSCFNKSTASNKFLEKGARRYVACLFSQIESSNIDIDSIKEKFGHIDDIYFNNMFMIRKMLADEVIIHMIRNIFEPMGLIIEDNTGSFKLSSRGKMVFEYYSFDMIKEYTELVEEAWECYDRENYEQANEMARNVISVVGNIPDAYNVIGCVYIKLGEYEKAKDIFMIAMELCEAEIGEIQSCGNSYTEIYVSMYYNLGLCYFYMGNYLRALGIFTSIRKTLPYNLDSLDVIMNSIKKIIVV